MASSFICDSLGSDLQGEPSVFASELAGMAGRAAEPRKGTRSARQIAGRDYEHSSTCQVLPDGV